MTAETPTPLTDAVKARVEKARNEVGLEYSTFLFQMVGELSDHARSLERANAALAEQLAAARKDFERECADGDRLCAALGIERTDGGSLQIQKMLNKIKDEV